MSISIALIGDYNKKVIAHNAIPLALEIAKSDFDVNITWTWLESTALNNSATQLNEFTAIWVVPGSPYNNMDGVLTAIHFARETARPFLGTCGGFQHALIEYARNVCGAQNAHHAEINPDSDFPVITPLSCSLVGKTGHISFTPGSQLCNIFQEKGTTESYHCNYGLNPGWKTRFEKAGLCFSGFDTEGQIRAFELATHPFFIGTLFQPERSALQEEQHLLISAFIKAIINHSHE